jgi:NIMA-interacting peptidyl-prolyl cis-trans isomerase 1
VNQYTKQSQWERPTEAAEKASTDKVQAKHLLVKHKESRRPSSWRQDVITRTKDEALNLLKEYRDKIESEENSFDSLAEQFSDCSSAKNNGDLGVFGRGQMQVGILRDHLRK